MMDGRAGHGQGLARGGIFGEFLDGVRRPSGRWRYGTIVVGRANRPCQHRAGCRRRRHMSRIDGDSQPSDTAFSSLQRA